MSKKYQYGYNYQYKAPSDRKKTIKWILLIAAAVLVVALAVAAVLLIVKDGKKIVDVVLSKAPTKTEYYIGDEPSYEGIVLQVILKNGNSYTVSDPSAMTFSGFNSNKATEEQQVVVSYEGYSLFYTVSIQKLPTPTPILTKIEIDTLPKTEYEVGDWLDTTGGILLCTYRDGSTLRVDMGNHMVDFPEELVAGQTYTLTVQYIEEGILAQTTYDITVVDPNAQAS